MAKQVLLGQPEDEAPFEDVRAKLPFLSFQIGDDSGWQTNLGHSHEYEQARRKVRARLGFYRHVATFAVVLAAVFFLDLVTGGGLATPVRWFAGVWGAILLWHAFNVFVFPSIWSRETEERMIEEEMKRHRS